MVDKNMSLKIIQGLFIIIDMGTVMHAVAARVENALSLALLHHVVFRNTLVHELGFTILEVRTRPLSPCMHSPNVVKMDPKGPEQY